MKYPVKVAPSVRRLDEFTFMDLEEALNMPGICLNPMFRRSGTSEMTGNVFMFDVDRPIGTDASAWFAETRLKVRSTNIAWGGYETKSEGLRLFVTARPGQPFNKVEYLAIYDSLYAMLKSAGVKVDNVRRTKGNHWWASPDKHVLWMCGEDLNWEELLGTSHLTVPPPERPVPVKYVDGINAMYQGLGAFDKLDIEFYRNSYPSGPIWPSAQHGPIPIKSMDNGHLVNAVRMLMRRFEEKARMTHSLDGSGVSYVFPVFADLAAEVRERGLEEAIHAPGDQSNRTYGSYPQANFMSAAEVVQRQRTFDALKDLPDVQAKVDSPYTLQWSGFKGTDLYKAAIARWEDREQLALTDEERKLVRQNLKTISFGMHGQGNESSDEMYDGAAQVAVNMLPSCHELPASRDNLAGWVDYAFAEAPLCLVQHSDRRWQVHAKDEVAIGFGHVTEHAAESFRQWLLTQCRARVESPAPLRNPAPDMIPPEVLKRRAPERKRVGGDQDWD